MHIDFDPGVARVLACVREMHAPIDTAITAGKEVDVRDFAALFGAVGALLDAIDARLNPAPAEAMREVA